MINPRMKHSKSGLALTERFEQCRLVAYIPRPGDVPTIGWGHTRNVHMGMTCSQSQADQWLVEDYAIAEASVNEHVNGPITQHEFDALCDFDFNLGGGALAKSTLLHLLNEGKVEEAADEFEKWDRAGGKVLAGLLRRRLEEKKEFLTPDESDEEKQEG